MTVNPWTQLADDALAAFQAVDDGAQSPFCYGLAALTVATRQDWTAAQTYLDKMRSYALRNSDGTLRGWSTTATGTIVYTITLADHILPVELAAYLEGGDVTSTEILEIAHLLMTTPRNNILPTGWGISYQTAAASAIDVYNCAAAVAGILRQIAAAGLVVPDANGAGSSTLAMQLGRTVTDRYQQGTNVAHNWAYSSTDGTPTDADHSSMMIETCWQFAPAVASHALDWLIATNYGTQPNAPLGHMRAGAYALDRVDVWLPEAQDYLDTQVTAQRKIQTARWAARIGHLQEAGG